MAVKDSKGRLFRLYKESDVTAGTYNIVGCQTTTSISINNNPIDITSKCSDGYVELMEGRASQQLEISMDFNINTAAISYEEVQAAVRNQTVLKYIVEVPGETPLAYSGSFIISAYSESGGTDEVITGSMTLQSSGAWAQEPLSNFTLA